MDGMLAHNSCVKRRLQLPQAARRPGRSSTLPARLHNSPAEMLLLLQKNYCCSTTHAMKLGEEICGIFYPLQILWFYVWAHAVQWNDHSIYLQSHDGHVLSIGLSASPDWARLTTATAQRPLCAPVIAMESSRSSRSSRRPEHFFHPRILKCAAHLLRNRDSNT